MLPIGQTPGDDISRTPLCLLIPFPEPHQQALAGFFHGIPGQQPKALAGNVPHLSLLGKEIFLVGQSLIPGLRDEESRFLFRLTFGAPIEKLDLERNLLCGCLGLALRGFCLP